MSSIALRPRSATEIVDASFRLLRQHYGQLVALSVVALLPYIVLLIVLGGDPADPARVIPVTITQIVCTTLAEAATIVAVSESYLEGRTEIGAALMRTLRRLPGIIGAAFIRGMLVGALTLVVLIIPGIVVLTTLPRGIGIVLVVLLAMFPAAYAVLRTFAVTAALMLEQTGAVAAVSRAWALAKGQVGRILGTLLLAWILYFAIFFVVTLIVGLLAASNPTVSAVFTAAVLAFAYPFIGIVTTLLYYDLRVRREGFDLEVMARELAPSH